MEITGKTLLHLNRTYYFDEDGYEWSSLEDARNESSNPDAVTVVRKQNCYMKEFSEMTESERDQAEFSVTLSGREDQLDELMYVFGASSGNLLLFGYWTEFQKDLDDNIYTVVEKKRN